MNDNLAEDEINEQDLITEIIFTNNKRMRDNTGLNQGLSDKQECDAFRKKFENVLKNVTVSLNEMRERIQEMDDPYRLIETVKQGYLGAMNNMCDTLDYGNNIQLLSRMTRKLKADLNEPQDGDQVDIFGRLEKLCYDFIMRLRKHEMQHVQDEVKLS